MGKGDKRTRRGKIFRGSTGKTRPTLKNRKRKKAKAKATKKKQFCKRSAFALTLRYMSFGLLAGYSQYTLSHPKLIAAIQAKL